MCGLDSNAACCLPGDLVKHPHPLQSHVRLDAQGGYRVSILLSVVGFVASCRLLLYSATAPNAWLHFAGCGMVGVVTAYAFVWIAQYYTDYK